MTKVSREAGRYDNWRDIPIGCRCVVCKLDLPASSVRVSVEYGVGLEPLNRAKWVCRECVGVIAEVAETSSDRYG